MNYLETFNISDDDIDTLDVIAHNFEGGFRDFFATNMSILFTNRKVSERIAMSYALFDRLEKILTDRLKETETNILRELEQ